MIEFIFVEIVIDIVVVVVIFSFSIKEYVYFFMFTLRFLEDGIKLSGVRLKSSSYKENKIIPSKIKLGVAKYILLGVA